MASFFIEFLLRTLGVLAMLALPLHGFGQAAPPGPPPVDPKAVEAAISKGVEYLRTAVSTPVPDYMPDSDEFILWTFLQAGVPESDPKVQSLFNKMLTSKLERTYKVSIQAMILEELDRVKYQGRIAQCAQFLLDNQCRNGQWSYGESSHHVESVLATATRKEIAADPDAGKAKQLPASSNRRMKPPVKTKIRVTKKRDGPAVGDNSNAQYAALGLRACYDAGIQLPQDAITLARKWWVDSQYAVRDKNADSPRTDAASDGTVFGSDARGWCYRRKGAKDCRASDRPYGSMTVGGIGALIIYDFMLAKDRKTDGSIQKGLAWLTKNFSVTENPGPCENSDERPTAYLGYYLYALERLGVLSGSEKIGGHEWYPEGAKVLLDAQSADGSWKVTHCTWAEPTTWDTCFAILFLRRATRPLEDVASEDKFLKGTAEQK